MSLLSLAKIKGKRECNSHSSFGEKIVVEKANLCMKHQKGDQRNPGGKIQFEAPFHVSNVKIICPERKKVLVFATNGERREKSTALRRFLE